MGVFARVNQCDVMICPAKNVCNSETSASNQRERQPDLVCGPGALIALEVEIGGLDAG